MKTILNILKISIILILLPSIAISQTDNTENNATSDDENFSSLMLNVSYTSNNLEYISGVSEKVPTLFSNLSYINKSGIYIGGSYANYFNDSIQSNDYSIQTGYQKYFDNGFDIDLSYSWHKFVGDSLLAGLNHDHSLDAMLGLEVGKFYFSGDLNYTIGKSNNFFFDFSLSRSFIFSKIFFKNDICIINPTLSASFGTDNWMYENMSDADKLAISNDLRSAGYSFESFSYEGFDIFLPISYGINNTYLTFSWLYKIPGKKYDYLGWEKQSGIMLSLTYFLNFSK